MKNERGVVQITMHFRSSSIGVGAKNLKNHRFKTTDAIQVALPGCMNSLMVINFQAAYEDWKIKLSAVYCLQEDHILKVASHCTDICNKFLYEAL
ncbi:hypothetical protein TNCT_209911 [Trichonephila clavata]|uniref:Uncharacterized protein n=1 Tax=Trichonephila clavata TaxID=2740835 RepID=A0A8X6J152_TRICU|nr:hypothetical protein TNCT_209911 [Trichonephila clavata]